MSDHLPRADEPSRVDRAAVLARLRVIGDLAAIDPEQFHCEADDLMLSCVEGPLAAELRQAYRACVKWYS